MTNRKPIISLSAGIVVLFMIFLMSCGPKTPTDLTRESIIPKPLSVTATGDYFCLGKKADIYVQGETEELKQVARYLAEKLRPATGFPLGRSGRLVLAL